MKARNCHSCSSHARPAPTKSGAPAATNGSRTGGGSAGGEGNRTSASTGGRRRSDADGGGGGGSVPGRPIHNCESPSRSVAPATTATARPAGSGRPVSVVPFADSRSVTASRSERTWTTAWWRLTAASSTSTAASPRPMTWSPTGSLHRRPASGPLSATSSAAGGSSVGDPTVTTHPSVSSQSTARPSPGSSRPARCSGASAAAPTARRSQPANRVTGVPSGSRIRRSVAAPAGVSTVSVRSTGGT